MKSKIPPMPKGSQEFGKAFEALAHTSTGGRKSPKAAASLPPAPNPVDSFQKTPKAAGRKSTPPAPRLPAKVKAIPAAAKTATVRDIQEVQGKPVEKPKGKTIGDVVWEVSTGSIPLNLDLSAPAPEKPKHGGKRSKSGGISKRQGKRDDGHKGRPPILDPKVQAHIVESVAELGMSEGRAALAAGVTPSTLSKWKQRGRLALESWDKLTPEEQTEESRYSEFFKALRDAEPYFERANLTTIQKAAITDWRAAKARLELKFPLRYGKRVMLGGDPENKNPIPTAVQQVDDMSDEEVKRRAERILKASQSASAPKAPPR